MSLPLFFGLLWSLLLTALVEGAAILIIFRRPAFVYYSALCNLLTNPAMNLLLAVSVSILGAGAYYPALILLEVVVVCVEAGVYMYICGFGIKKSVALSAFLNALSFASGTLFYFIIGW